MSKNEYAPVGELPKEKLLAELETLVAHEDAAVLTSNQRDRLDDIRDEMFKRMAVGGEYGDYTGPEDNE